MAGVGLDGMSVGQRGRPATQIVPIPPCRERKQCPGVGRPKGRHMQLGMIGLGRMGGNMVRRLMRAGHECVVYDLNSQAVDELTREGATGTKAFMEFVARL